MKYSVQDSAVEGRDQAIPVRDYIPVSRTAQTALLWVHGGGFSSGGLGQKESDAPARVLAARGRRVRTIDYRLVPRPGLRSEVETGPHPNRFPAAHHDVLDVVSHLVAELNGPVSLGGASAGANLAAGAAMALRGSGGAELRSLVLAYGVYHAALPDRPDVENDLRGPLAKWAFNPSMTHKMNLNYVGAEADLQPGYAFPGGADLQGLPPALVLNASNDRLRRSGDAFADELRTAGVEVRHEVVRLFHGFLGARLGRGFRMGVHEISEWLTNHD